MKKSILCAQGVCKSFAHNGTQYHILNHVDLTLYEGDFTVIMGASGSGKSTLLYCLSGMDTVTGEVICNDRNIVLIPNESFASCVMEILDLYFSKCTLWESDVV